MNQEILEESSNLVLIVDNDKKLSKSYVDFLEAVGFLVILVHTGTKGLEVFQKNEKTPDLVLIDLNIKDISGVDLLKKMKAIHTNIPIIVLSETKREKDIVYSLRYGAFDYILKPITDFWIVANSITRAFESINLSRKNKEYEFSLKEKLRILKEDQIAGKVVQEMMLPSKNKKINNYNFKRSGFPSLYLSGDFVDYFKVSNNKVCVYLADVSGHGASSAFITIFLKTTICNICNSYKFRNESNITCVQKLMEKLNKEIHNLKIEKYLTIIFCILDTKSNRLAYSVAGHYPSPILLESDGNTNYIEGTGFPIGILPNTTYKASEIEFNKSDKLLLFSDGIMEILCPDKTMDIKYEKLLKIISEKKGDLTEIEKFFNLTDDENISRPDDITLLSINRDD